MTSVTVVTVKYLILSVYTGSTEVTQLILPVLT